MNKYILPLLIILGILFFSFFVYQLSKDLNNNLKGTLTNEKSNADSGFNSDSAVDSNINEKIGTSSNTASSSAGGGGGSGSSSSGSSSGGSTTPLEERINESSCVLIRPGNLPNVNCFVNYIKKDSVSLRIENKLGEDIGISLDLISCSPKLQDSIKNNEQMDFVFSCANNDYFSQEILINYFLNESGTVKIGGFVSGYVSD